jgi:hypothetical protein
MIAIEFTPEDVRDPKLFISEVTRNRLSGVEEELALLQKLLSVLECTRPEVKGRARALSTTRRLVARAAKKLEHVREDIRSALERRRSRVSWQWCGERIEMNLAEKEPSLEVASDELTALGEKLRLLLILLLTLGRTCKRLRREPLGQAKSAVREASELLFEAQAVMERAFPGELHRDGGRAHAEFTRRAS